MRNKSVTKVAIVDRNQIYKKGLVSILRSQEVITEVTGYDTLDSLESVREDAIFLIEHELIFESEETVSLVKQYAGRSGSKVISLADNADEVDLPATLEAGICGVLIRSMFTEELISAFRIIRSGECYVAHDVSKKYLSEVCTASERRKRDRSKPMLTNRETQVLKMICDDLTNSEIADRLFISPRTVDGHRSNILQKLGIRSKAGLVRFAMENNMLAGIN